MAIIRSCLPATPRRQVWLLCGSNGLFDGEALVLSSIEEVEEENGADVEGDPAGTSPSYTSSAPRTAAAAASHFSADGVFAQMPNLGQPAIGHVMR